MNNISNTSKIIWDGREITQCTSSLSNHPNLKKLDDKSMLSIIKKYTTDMVFQFFYKEGFEWNNTTFPDEFNFMDLAIINGNCDSLSWLIKNIPKLIIVTYTSFYKNDFINGFG